MRKMISTLIICVFLVVICLLTSGCNRIKIKPTNSSSLQNELSSEENVNSLAGTYKYDYPDDTEDLVEDHYIVLEVKNGSLEGRYYGTSDDFDQAREGYYPGFFVSSMHDLQIENGELTFNIGLKESDMFSNPVDSKYITSEEVSLSENPQWNNSQIVDGSDKNPRNYTGEIADGKIVLHMDDGDRIFIKQKK